MNPSRRALLFLLLPALATAQTLAHPGWRGNGIAAERWWQHAAVVQMPPEITFAQATAALESVATAGADTVLLPDLQPLSSGASFAERFGTMDDLDALLREASARRMHVLLTAPLLRLANNSGGLRFWLTRGIAGFNVGTLRPADLETLQLLRTAMDRYPGQQLLLVSLDATADKDFVVRFQRAFHAPTIQLFTMQEAASLPAGAVGAVTVTNPASTPPIHGLLPVLPLTEIETQSGAVAAQKWLARSRAKQSRSPAHRR